MPRGAPLRWGASLCFVPLPPDPMRLVALARSFALATVALASLFALAPAASAQIPDALAGRWSGAAVSDGVPRLFDLQFEVEGDSLTTILTQPYNGFTRFGFDFRYTSEGPADGTLTGGLFGDEMRLLVDLADGSLRGTVASADSVTATVYLRRVLDYPLPGFSFAEASVPAGADTLSGTLLVPEGAGPHPAAVLVAGRGGYRTRGDMGEWAALLARNGIAALVYDQRGVGRSTGRPEATGETRVENVDAALDWLRAQDGIDGARVGVLSYSAGGWVTPLAIQDRDDVAFWVSLAGPAEGLAAQQGHTTTQLMRASGEEYAAAEYAAAFAYQARLVELAQAEAPWSDYAPLNAAARSARWAAHALIPDSLQQEDLAYYRSRTAFNDPDDALRRLDLPILALYGGADVIVHPDDNVPRLRQLVGDDALTVVVLDGAEHSLGRPAGVHGAGDWPEGFRRPWARPGRLFTTIVDWTRERVGLAR